MKNEEIEKMLLGATKHHTSRARRYVSRKSDGEVQKYDGKFGRGFKVFRPAWDSTTYCFVEYWIAK